MYLKYILKIEIKMKCKFTFTIKLYPQDHQY